MQEETHSGVIASDDHLEDISEKVNELLKRSEKNRRESFMDLLLTVGLTLIAISLAFWIDLMDSHARIQYGLTYGILGLTLIVILIALRLSGYSHHCRNVSTSVKPRMISPLPNIGTGWDIKQDAMKQLDQLNAMERQQDTNMWSSTAMFAAASGVLMVALVTGMGRIAKEGELEIAFGVLGSFICIAWTITATRAIKYYIIWIKRALKLQSDYGIPEEYCIWQDVPPAGIKGSIAKFMTIMGFIGAWTYAGAIGAMQTGVSWHAVIVIIVFLTAIASVVHSANSLRELDKMNIEEIQKNQFHRVG